jgi:hypothetical protein
MFLEGGEWSALTEFTSLPYLWHKPRQGCLHHMADVICVITIVAQELAFNSPFSYIESHEWTICKKKDHYMLQYQKIHEAVATQTMVDG